jgi:hypothetical protein
MEGPAVDRPFAAMLYPERLAQGALLPLVSQLFTVW